MNPDGRHLVLVSGRRKKLQTEQGRSLGKLVSSLVAEALARRKTAPVPARLRWVSRPMHALVNLADKEAISRVLDRRQA